MVAAGGGVSITLSFFSGFGLLFYCQQESQTLMAWMPFLATAIGLEHIFVLCNAVDQTDLSNSSYSRIHEALSHAGPSITITTLVTCLAFALGMFSSLKALTIFCLFATVTVAMLFINTMTLFLAALVWDTRR